MNYRKATKEDADKLDNLLTKLILDEKNNYDNSLEAVKIKNFYINYIEKENYQIFLCEEEKNIVGYIYIIINNKTAKIDALYIEEKYRNQGIGANLIESALSWIKEKNIKNIELNVLTQNKQAKKLYEKYGFITFKETMKLNI